MKNVCQPKNNEVVNELKIYGFIITIQRIWDVNKLGDFFIAIVNLIPKKNEAFENILWHVFKQ